MEVLFILFNLHYLLYIFIYNIINWIVKLRVISQLLLIPDDIKGDIQNDIHDRWLLGDIQGGL